MVSIPTFHGMVCLSVSLSVGSLFIYMSFFFIEGEILVYCMLAATLLWVFFKPILDDGLNEKFTEILKGCPLYSLLCLSVCRLRATGHTF